MHIIIYGVYYSKDSHQHVSAGIPAIFSWRLLLQLLVDCDAINPQ